MKNAIRLLAAAVIVLILTGCRAGTLSGLQGNLTDLKLGADRKEISAVLGGEGKSTGTTPERIIYSNIQLFDFVEQSETTKLTVFLNTEGKAYAYAYYLYDAREKNYSRIKDFFEQKYGPASEGENASELWKEGEVAYSLFNQPEYIAISIF